MSRLKILHLVESLGGGVLEFVRLLANGSADAGHDVAVAFGRRPETPDILEGEFGPLVRLKPLPWINRSPLSQVKAARAIRRSIAQEQPDLVHLHSSYAGAMGAVLLPRSIPSVFTPNAYPSMLPEIHGPRLHAYRRLERFASRRATIVGAVSPSEEQLASSYVSASRVVLIENGIRELDAERRQERTTWPPPRVIAVGRTVPQRQPTACARILSAVAEFASVAWIGGGGGDRGKAGFEGLCEAGIAPTGWVERQRVMQELDRSTAYLHWTAWDGQSFSILEAMARDVVTIASDIPPNRELLGPRPVCSTEAQAVELLRKVVRDRPFAEDLLAEQRERRATYSAERMVSEWLDLYRGSANPVREQSPPGDAPLAPAPG